MICQRLFILKFSFSDCFLFSNLSIYEKKTTQDVIYRIFSTGKTPWTQKQVKRKVLAGWCHWWWLRCKMWMYKEFIQDKGAKQLQLNVLGQNKERQNHLMLKDFTEGFYKCMSLQKDNQWKKWVCWREELAVKRLNEFLPLPSQAKPAPGPLYFCKEGNHQQQSRSPELPTGWTSSVWGALVVHRGVQRDCGVTAHHLGGAAAATAGPQWAQKRLKHFRGRMATTDTSPNPVHMDLNKLRQQDSRSLMQFIKASTWSSKQNKFIASGISHFGIKMRFVLG